MALGHQDCRAVKATIKTVESNGHGNGHIGSLVEAIRLAVVQAKRSRMGDLLDNPIKVSVALQVESLKKNEIVLYALTRGAINLVGAYHDLRTGQVEIIE